MKLTASLLTLTTVVTAYLWWQNPPQAAEIPIPVPQISITLLPFEPVTLSPGVLPAGVTQDEPQEDGSQVPTTSQTTEPPPIPTETTVNCATQDSQGLASAFRRELSIFLNNAAATYGSQYSNLQYSISNQQISQDESQGTIRADYQGSVQEIGSGEIISTSGSMSVTFSWDKCNWILLDYSYF